MRSTTQRNTPRPLPWDVRRRPKIATMPRAGEAIRMWLRIVATVALQDVGQSAPPPTASANGGQVRDQGVEVGDVVDVRGRDMRHQRYPARIGHDVVFGPRLAAIGWVRSSFFPRASRGPARCPPPSSAGRAVPAAQHKQDAGERRARRRGFGTNGSRRAHSASSNRGCAMRDRTKSTAQVQEISQRF